MRLFETGHLQHIPNNNRIRKVTAIANLNSSTYNVTFPSQNVGNSSTQTVTLSGVGPLDIEDITIASTDGHFTEKNNCPSGSLASGSSCQVHITFTPRSKGAEAGILTIKTNGFFNPTVTINFTGTGT